MIILAQTISAPKIPQIPNISINASLFIPIVVLLMIMWFAYKFFGGWGG
jgi:hypothetical protein